MVPDRPTVPANWATRNPSGIRLLRTGSLTRGATAVR